MFLLYSQQFSKPRINISVTVRDMTTVITQDGQKLERDLSNSVIFNDLE